MGVLPVQRNHAILEIATCNINFFCSRVTQIPAQVTLSNLGSSLHFFCLRTNCEDDLFLLAKKLILDFTNCKISVHWFFVSPVNTVINNFFSVVIFINFHVTKIVGFATICTAINGVQNAVFQLFRLCSLTKLFEFQRGKIAVGPNLCRSFT